MTNPTPHSITVPSELVQQWLGEFFGCTLNGELSSSERYLASRAAQWGADQELETCIKLIDEWGWEGWSEKLRDTRRPKPPSTIEIAEKLIARYSDGWTPSPDDWVIIRDALADGRRAQEALND